MWFCQRVNELLNLKLSNQEIISLCQRAEHDFAGTKCGIMDQYAVINGHRQPFFITQLSKNYTQISSSTIIKS